MSDAAQTQKLTAEEFYAWCREQPEGRFELVSGEVVAMAPERVAHVRLKARVWEALRDALRQSGSSCEALTDGASVRIDDATVYEPDALVHHDPELSPDAVDVPEPVVVVEVLSPSTAGRDAGAKLDDYFRLPSVAHYLLFKTERPTVIHHHRLPDGSITTAIHTSGPLELDPPGITIDIDRVFEAA